MKNILSGLAALTLTTTLATIPAHAGGIDRSGQGVGPLFETGNVVELSFGQVMPSVSGNDMALFGGKPSGNVANDFTQFGLAIKTDLNDHLSAALIIDQPFGADIAYGTSSVALGGTIADASSQAVTGLLRYRMDSGFSVHGGLRVQTSKAHVVLKGAAYGGLNGYAVDLDQETATGYVLGAAYEKPEIALRVALTYNSAIDYKFATLETLGAATIGVTDTAVSTPQSVNLDFQSGVAADTLVFGQIRWADWSEFRLDPATFTALAKGGLIELEDSTTWTIGVGRKFNDTWSGAASISYEAEGDPLVSPLAPTNGKLGLTLAGIYTKGNMKISTGINYTDLGDAQPETGTPDVARASFTGNSALGVGVKVSFQF
jgi:long-chain fatty acid transport protein